jgi:hypothetical protein
MSNLALKHKISFLNIYTTSTLNDNEKMKRITIQMMKVKKINNGKYNQM